jgi:Lar family restriction alleviation protein
MTVHDDDAGLLPCPFCGGAATAWKRDINGNSPSVWCRNSVTCGGEVSLHDDKLDAIASWNTRLSPTIAEGVHYDLANMTIRCRHLLSCIDSCNEANAAPRELDREDIILIEATRAALEGNT